MKVAINLFVPVIAECYDILVPDSLPIREITSMIANAIVSLTNNRYAVSGQEIICLSEKNIMLQEAYTLADYNIKNGDHLIII